MKLVDKMKDENLGLAILYNFTKGYGHVPMSVYDVVLPFLYHDGFRNHLFEGVEVEEALTKCVQEDASFIQNILDTIEKDKEMTSRALGICLSKLNQFGQVTIYKQSNPEEVIERIKEADIIITNKCLLTEEVLQYASKVKLICITATGVNNVDLDYCHRRGITVCNVAGYSSLSVAQHTFALALELLHKNSYYHNYVQSGQYSESGMFSHIGPRFYELHEKTWGIIGMGNIGRTVAKIAEAFGCQVQYYSTSGKNTKQDYLSVDLETLLKTSDIVSIHCPLNEQTKGLIGEESFKLMKKEAILINVGRGGIVDEEALVEALQNNEIAGAGLDVFEREPLAKESPLLQINDASKLLMTPHIAWATVEARNRLFDLVVDNIQGFLKGDLKNVC